MIHTPNNPSLQQLWQPAALLVMAGLFGAWWRRQSTAKLVKIRVERDPRERTH